MPFLLPNQQCQSTEGKEIWHEVSPISQSGPSKFWGRYSSEVLVEKTMTNQTRARLFQGQRNCGPFFIFMVPYEGMCSIKLQDRVPSKGLRSKELRERLYLEFYAKLFTWRRRSCIVRVTILLYGSTTRLRILHRQAQPRSENVTTVKKRKGKPRQKLKIQKCSTSSKQVSLTESLTMRLSVLPNKCFTE